MSQSSAAFEDISPSFQTGTVIPFGNTLKRLLITEPEYKWRNSVVTRLEELVRLPYGWDGYDGEPVLLENANFALRMLESLCSEDAKAPQIVPGNKGDLQIEWHKESYDIELDVHAPNRVHAWRLSKDTHKDGEEHPLTNDFIVVTQWLKEFYGD